MKTAEEILHKHTDNGVFIFNPEWDDVISAMEEYADQFRAKSESVPIEDEALLTVDYLMQLHPALNHTQAESLLKYLNEHTIYYRECYGNGDLLFSRWMNIYF